MLDTQTRKAVRDKSLVFDDENPLTTQFALAKKAKGNGFGLKYV